MSSQEECLSQRTSFCTAGSHKPIEVKQQSLARVAQIMGVINEEKAGNASNENKSSSEYDHEFDGDEIDDDLVFSTVPQRSSASVTTANIHFDEIDDEEMRLFAESLEQKQQDVKTDAYDKIDDEIDDDQLCEDYARKMQTPTKSVQIENNKRKEPCIEDLDALLNDDDTEENTVEYSTQQQKTSPVFKKKP